MTETSELERRLAGLGRPRVLIIGDLILSNVGGESVVFAPDIEWYLNLPPNMLTDWTLHRTAHLSWLEAALAYGNAALVVLTWGTVIWAMVRRR